MQQLEISPKLTLDIPSGATITVKKVGKTDGYDGHCLRAYKYFGNQMPDIDPNSVYSINSIEQKYPELRQASKVPTFLLTYGGTHIGIFRKTGLPMDVAKSIESNYHELYKESDEWVAKHIEEASKTGYVEVAFGMRLRTPLLAKTIRGTRDTPYKVEAEARTAGNALGQSWGMLNSRAATEFMNKVRASKYRTMIRPCTQIHDAQYYLIKDDVEVIKYVNDNLIKAIQWQEHPLIKHDKVKLGGDLCIYYPTWNDPIKIPNGADEEIIKHIMEKEKWLQELKRKYAKT